MKTMVITQIRDTLGWAIFHYLKGVISGFLDQWTLDVSELTFGVLMTCPNFYEVDCIFSPQKMIKRVQERLPSLWEIILLPFEENAQAPSNNYATTTSRYGYTNRESKDSTPIGRCPNH